MFKIPRAALALQAVDDLGRESSTVVSICGAGERRTQTTVRSGFWTTVVVACISPKPFPPRAIIVAIVSINSVCIESTRQKIPGTESFEAFSSDRQKGKIADKISEQVTTVTINMRWADQRWTNRAVGKTFKWANESGCGDVLCASKAKKVFRPRYAPKSIIPNHACLSYALYVVLYAVLQRLLLPPVFRSCHLLKVSGHHNFFVKLNKRPRLHPLVHYCAPLSSRLVIVIPTG